MIFVSLIGKSNCGKSSLFNNLARFNLSIVTFKNYTTNRLVFFNYLNKINFIDTPGPIIKKAQNNKNNINKMIYDCVYLSNVILMIVTYDLVVDDFFLIDLLKNENKIKILIVSKIDKIRVNLNFFCQLNLLKQKFNFHLILLLSNITFLNINKLFLYFCITTIVIKKHLLDEQFILDCVRKILLLSFKKELPYNIKIIINNINEFLKFKILFLEFIFTKNCQKKIFIGKNGCKIKYINQLIYEELSKFFFNIKKINIKLSVLK